ncbi:MAG TPA: PilC/PilY family type IV pilus protein [Thiopseudomonas sp.]|nr:PilC/PilY family type IV pilus protein [Thiopseudomonas sp.]
MNTVFTKLAAAVLDARVVCSISLLLVLAPVAQADIAQSPLLLGGGNIPGNLVLTPSAEYPTVISVANLGDYSLDGTYAGYFDSRKCYEYEEEDIDNHLIFGKVKKKDGAGYFKPQNFDFKDNNKNCNGKWSGHYLNWAGTQTIDPFRKALTGGYRAVDTKNQTILEKATRANRSEFFADRVISPALAGRVTPYGTGFSRLTSSVVSGNGYQKNKTLQIIRETDRFLIGPKKDIEYFSVRVEVCKKGLLEDNCKQYGDNYKPEGLLQEYADDIRYSVFSYLNIDGNNLNGGVLRAPQDYIGVNKRTPGTPGLSDNIFKEWDSKTGVLHDNPRNDGTGNSGVINYINKFGEKSNQHKSNDPVSELYYAAIRYLRGKGNITDYTSQANSDLKKDYFPVVTNWVDPIQYTCQKNAILGIGDTNTHEDRNLLPSDDNAFMNPHGLNGYTKKVFDLEGVNKSASAVFTGRGNSAYIAGLAYYANTQDMRPDMAGKQTASTYWVDVRENQVLAGRSDNQYWLAAKYGGFKVPKTYSYGNELQEAWWHPKGEFLSSNYPRPNNFYVASDAEAMVESLRQAFVQIASEGQGTTAALAASSSKLQEGSLLFQSNVNSTAWSGDLRALKLAPNGINAEPVWSAAAKLDGIDNSKIENRNILSIKSVQNQAVLTQGINFNWSSLSNEQKTQLESQDKLNYLRGERSKELTAAQPSGVFRERSSRLGDIVNSDPQFVYQENQGYTRLSDWDKTITNKYSEFRATEAYKKRVPMVVVGANDGMLHAFDARTDANGGRELFAFVPNAVYDNLSELADPEYTHRYYVDGTPRITDAWLGDKWATVAVGVSGAGGKSVFALNVTNVASNSSVTSADVMWEFTHPKMGYNMGQPAIVALPNKKFGVVVSSGYHDQAPDKGYVWILDVKDGSILREFEFNTQANLGGVLVADLNNDKQADRIYVAGTDGKIWRVDLSSADASKWAMPAGLKDGPLFTVTGSDNKPQAITAPLVSTFNKKGRPMVVFGTGSFYRLGDKEIPESPPIESLYGLFDTGQPISGRTSLLQQTIETEEVGNEELLRAVSENQLTTQQGWYLDLAWLGSKTATGAKGERVVARAQVRSDLVVFTTMTPVNDPCASGGISMDLALNLSNGGRLKYDYLGIENSERVWSGISDLNAGVAKGVLLANGQLVRAGSSAQPELRVVTREKVSTTLESWRQVR